MDLREISATELHNRKSNSAVLIDTLPSDHFNQLHLPGAVNACVYEVTFLEQVKTIVADTTDEIILYGAGPNSHDSRMAAEKLQRGGYENILVFVGGIEAWRKEGYNFAGENVEFYNENSSLLALPEGEFHLYTAESIVEWAGRNQNSKHFGSLKFDSGQIQSGASSFTGKLTVDMESMENINLAGDELQSVLIEHLKSDDFFFTKLFPQAVLKINKGTLHKTPYLTSTNATIETSLHLRGITKPLDFEATLIRYPEDKIGIEAHFDLDRTKWGIIYGSARFFEHLGMHTVFDNISIQLKCVFLRQS